MYASIADGHRSTVTKSKESKVIQILYGWTSAIGVIIQDTDTTTEEWFGLSQSDAESLCVASESSTLSGATRQYLGSARLTQQVEIGSGAYCTSPSCWGQKIVSSMNRMSDTNLYHVTRTTTNYTVRGAGDNVVLTLM